jgi:hypothetical protein
LVLTGLLVLAGEQKGEGLSPTGHHTDADRMEGQDTVLESPPAAHT